VQITARREMNISQRSRLACLPQRMGGSGPMSRWRAKQHSPGESESWMVHRCESLRGQRWLSIERWKRSAGFVPQFVERNSPSALLNKFRAPRCCGGTALFG
jgi:hypothetical protein